MATFIPHTMETTIESQDDLKALGQEMKREYAARSGGNNLLNVCVKFKETFTEASVAKAANWLLALCAKVEEDRWSYIVVMKHSFVLLAAQDDDLFKEVTYEVMKATEDRPAGRSGAVIPPAGSK